MLKIGNGNMAVITDRRLVKEVLDRKSGIYSHRPHSFVSHDLITKGNHLLVMHYGDQWRTFRRLVHQHFMETMVENHQTKIVNAEAIQLVRDYMIDPEHHMAHPKRYSNSITNSIGMSLIMDSLCEQPLNSYHHSIRNPHGQPEGIKHATAL